MVYRCLQVITREWFLRLTSAGCGCHTGVDKVAERPKRRRRPDLQTRVCRKCGVEKGIGCFYPARARFAGGQDGWQSHCRDCWKVINAENKLRRKLSGV
jgi:hypothetical protein